MTADKSLQKDKGWGSETEVCARTMEGSNLDFNAQSRTNESDRNIENKKINWFLIFNALQTIKGHSRAI